MNGIATITTRWHIPSYLTNNMTNDQIAETIAKAVEACLESIILNVSLDPINIEIDGGIYKINLELPDNRS